MTAESLSKIVEQSLNSVSLQDIKDAKKRPIKDQIFALLKLVTGDVVGAAESEMQAISDYKESEFFRKYTCYLYELVDTTPEERHKFCQEIHEKAEDFSGNVILGMVDRLDNINKETIFARLTIARIHGAISIEDFFRLHSMLERIPYVDLKELPRYKNPFCDESGDTELLYATGALLLQTLDANGSNKYILSVLGEKLLHWGCCINLEMERINGTNVALNYATNDDIDEIFDKKMKASRPKYKDGTLYFPDGTISGELEDDKAYLYDLTRGK
jgi:hypothetical protein